MVYLVRAAFLIFLLGEISSKSVYAEDFDIIGIKLGMPIEAVLKNLGEEYDGKLTSYVMDPDLHHNDLTRLMDMPISKNNDYVKERIEKNNCLSIESSFDEIFKHGHRVVSNNKGKEEFFIYYDVAKINYPIVAFVRVMQHDKFGLKHKDIQRALEEKYKSPDYEHFLEKSKIEISQMIWASSGDSINKSKNRRCSPDLRNFIYQEGNHKKSCFLSLFSYFKGRGTEIESMPHLFPWFDYSNKRSDDSKHWLDSTSIVDDCGQSLGVHMKDGSSAYALIDTSAVITLRERYQNLKDIGDRTTSPDPDVKF